MARLPTEERERVIAAIRAHAVSGGDLSSSGYSQAAGCSQEMARTIARKLGLPMTYRPAAKARDAAPAAPEADSTEPTVQPETSSTGPGSGGIPVTRDEVGKLIQAHVRAATQSGPPAHQTQAKSPTMDAVLKASAAVAAQHVQSVVTQSERWQTWDEEAGEMVRRLFYDSGLRNHFDGPGQMVQALADFWWSNRDLVPALQEQLDAAVARIGELMRQMDPEVRQQQARDQVWAIALTAVMAGHPLSREDFAYYLEVAEARAVGAPIPEPSPPVSSLRFGR